MKNCFRWIAVLVIVATQFVVAQPALKTQIDNLANSIEPNVIEWRRHFHQNPELSNREFNTSKKIAEHLKSLGLEVKTGVAHTGVVGLLKGGQPGPVVALRADMDGLPVVERVNLPFASKARSTYNGQDVGVMHACGHDTHISILMGAAEILTSMKHDLRGTVKFIFQPAEEGAPEGEEGGAELMVKQGVLENPKVDVVFGLHISAQEEVNTLRYRPGGLMAASDRFRIKVTGRQTHGAYPWEGVDPIVISAQIINGLQTIVSRQMQLTENPVVVTVGTIHGGVRNNIIPEEVEMAGTIRTLDTLMQNTVHEKIRRTAISIAQSGGAFANVTITKGTPVTFNDPELTEKMLPTLQSVAGKEKTIEMKPVMGAEDYSFYAQQVPALFFFIGGRPINVKREESAAHHTPDFFIDESGLKLGVRVMCNLAVDYMAMAGK
ncbi:MAG TPA: amidohydrolase [Bacteroidota bacterium]